MPLYEYKCEDCGKVVEVLAASAAENAMPRGCECGKEARFVRLYSTFAAVGESRSELQFAPCGRAGGCGTCEANEGY